MALLRFERSEIEFSIVKKPKSITRLEIAFCDLTTLHGIERFAKLKQLHIYYCRHLGDISAIGLLPSLEQVNLYSLPNVKREFTFAKLRRLQDLSYTSIKRLSTLRGIEHLPALTHLGLSRVKVLDGAFGPIVASPSLKRVFWFGGPFKAPALREIRRLRPDVVVGGNAHNVD